MRWEEEQSVNKLCPTGCICPVRWSHGHGEPVNEEITLVLNQLGSSSSSFRDFGRRLSLVLHQSAIHKHRYLDIHLL